MVAFLAANFAYPSDGGGYLFSHVYGLLGLCRNTYEIGCTVLVDVTVFFIWCMLQYAVIIYGCFPYCVSSALDTWLSQLCSAAVFQP